MVVASGIILVYGRYINIEVKRLNIRYLLPHFGQKAILGHVVNAKHNRKVRLYDRKKAWVMLTTILLYPVRVIRLKLRI